MTKIDELKNKIREALGDPDAPWYGSDLVSLVGDYIEETDKRIEELEVEKIADVRCSIDSEGKYTKYTYCYTCGAGVRNQKYCRQCGRKLNWQALKPRT